MYPVVVVSLAFLQYLFETLIELFKLPFRYAAYKADSLLHSGNKFYDYHGEVDDAIEVLQSMKKENGKDNGARMRKTISSQRDLASYGSPKTLEVKDTNRFNSSHWLSQSFPDLFWAMNTFVEPEWPVPPPRLRREIKEQILESTNVKEAIKISAKVNNISVEKSRKEAEKIYEAMASDTRMPIMRMLAFFIRKLLRLLYPFGVNVAVADIEKIKDIARKAVIVYLPCHKSYIDFLVVSYICFSHGLPLPNVVAGENLNIPLVGRLLRFGGAFFIRRSFGSDGDPLYRTIFNEYVKRLVLNGSCTECFIEGGRSRSGKVLQPKPGFLRVIIDAVADGEIEDVYFVPISLGYDRIVENDAYIKELTGGRKKAEQLLTLLTSGSVLIAKAINKTLCFGQINVGFGEPISVANYLEAERVRTNFEGNFSNEQRKQITRNLGYRTLYLINYSSTILPATMVGTILLTQYGRGIKYEELINSFKWLRQEVLARGGRVRQQTDEEVSSTLISVVNNVLETKSSRQNKLVKRHKDILMLSLYSPAEQIELALYRNQLIHYFVSEGIVACSFYAIEKESTSTPSLVSKKELFEKTEYLSRLLKLEFIYKPSPAIKDTFEQTINFMIKRNILEQSEGADSYFVNENPPNPESQGTFSYLFLCSLFWPFIDSYWLASLCLYRLLPDRITDEIAFINFTQSIGERLFFEGLIDLYEAISQETLQNAVTLYESIGIIQFLNIEGQSVHNPGKRVIQLQTNLQNEEKLRELVITVGSYRKRLTAYRSRRFKLRRNNYVVDAIENIKHYVQELEAKPK